MTVTVNWKLKVKFVVVVVLELRSLNRPTDKMEAGEVCEYRITFLTWPVPLQEDIKTI